MPSPTSLTLAALRRSGYVCNVVERFVPVANIRRDLFGCIDVIAVSRREPEILAIQCTSLGHVADRLAKARTKPGLALWLRGGGKFAVWGWYRRGGKWQAKQVEVRGEDLADVVLARSPRRRKRSEQPGLFD